MTRPNIIAFIFEVMYFPVGQAGTIGADSTSSQVASGAKPYLSIDSSYTWIKARGFSINNRTPFLKSKPWGGRLAAGLTYPIFETLRLSTEFGGGYIMVKYQVQPLLLVTIPEALQMGMIY